MAFNGDTAEIFNLAEVISSSTDYHSPQIGVATPKKRVSKTSMLLAILVSIALMILMEIVTAIYKNLSTDKSGCLSENGSE